MKKRFFSIGHFLMLGLALSQGMGCANKVNIPAQNLNPSNAYLIPNKDRTYRVLENDKKQTLTYKQIYLEKDQLRAVSSNPKVPDKVIPMKNVRAVEVSDADHERTFFAVLGGIGAASAIIGLGVLLYGLGDLNNIK